MTMLYIRSLFNAIGSGAGVAWPMFGIVFAVLGGTVASALSLALGGAAIALFSATAIGIYYFSSQATKEQLIRSQKRLEKNQQKLALDLEDYLQSIQFYFTQQHNIKESHRYIQHILQCDLARVAQQDSTSPLFHLLTFVHKEYSQHQQFPTMESIKKQLATQAIQNKIPWSTMLIASFSAFVGVFGSVAGCSAGLAGVLTGIGLFSSFSAFPILGWGVIGLALVCGLILACSAAYDAYDQYKKDELNQCLKSTHQQLSKATAQRNLEALAKGNKNHLLQIAVNRGKSNLKTLSFFNVNDDLSETSTKGMPEMPHSEQLNCPL